MICLKVAILLLYKGFYTKSVTEQSNHRQTAQITFYKFKLFTITFSILVLLAELCSMRKPSNISPTPSLKARLSGKSCCGCLHISSTIVSFSFSQFSLGCCTEFVLGWMWRWMWTWGWSWCDVVDLFDIAMTGSCNWEQKLWGSFFRDCEIWLNADSTPHSFISVGAHRHSYHLLIDIQDLWLFRATKLSLSSDMSLTGWEILELPTFELPLAVRSPLPIGFEFLLRVSCLRFLCLTIVNYCTTM